MNINQIYRGTEFRWSWLCKSKVKFTSWSNKKKGTRPGTLYLNFIAFMSNCQGYILGLPGVDNMLVALAGAKQLVQPRYIIHAGCLYEVVFFFTYARLVTWQFLRSKEVRREHVHRRDARRRRISPGGCPSLRPHPVVHCMPRSCFWIRYCI